MKNNTSNVYVVIEPPVHDITDEQIKLDNYTDEEYSTPYDDDYSDITNVGGIIEGGDIFADRQKYCLW